MIGVGTAHGDDAAGLLAAEACRASGPPGGVEVTTCEHPGADLLEAFSGADAVILIDAVRSGSAPGEVRRLARDELVRARAFSSHGFGVAEALAFAEALDRLPARVEIVGIEAGHVAPGAVSRAVRRGSEAAARLVAEVVAEILGAARDD